jgi:hypothetical protein
VGLALALGFGVVLGAGFVWLAGAVLDWQRDLAFTFGVAQRLLPFGDQQALLRNVEASWYVVIPVVGLTVGLFGGLLGGLIGALLAATYNRSPRHAMIIVELPEAATQHGAPESAAGEAPVTSAEPAGGEAPAAGEESAARQGDTAAAGGPPPEAVSDQAETGAVG